MRGDNWLGVALAALMRIEPEQARGLGREALERISESSLTEQHRYLLASCLDLYLPLDEAGRAELDQYIADQEVRVMTKGIITRAFDEGIEKGLSRGIHQGQLQLIRAVLERRFGALPEPFVERLNSLPAEKLVTVGVNAVTAKSLDELGVE